MPQHFAGRVLSICLLLSLVNFAFLGLHTKLLALRFQQDQQQEQLLSTTTTKHASQQYDDSDDDDDTTYIAMPQIAYPQGTSFGNLPTKAVKVSGQGGWEAKFAVQLNQQAEGQGDDDDDDKQQQNDRFLFKPAHGEIVVPGGWMWRWNKGGFHYQEERLLPTQVLNEYLAFTIDQMLGLGRVPTVVPFAIDHKVIQQAIQEQLATHKHKHLRSKMNLDVNSWNEWLQANTYSDSSSSSSSSDDTTTTTTTTTATTAVIGTLQYMVPDVQHPLKRVFQLRRQIQNDFYGREVNTRSLYDYLIANVDRGNNNFLHEAAGGGAAAAAATTKQQYEAPPALVYIDQNLLSERDDLGSLFFFEDQQAAVTADTCRFYWEPVEKLRSLPEFSEAVLEQMQTSSERISRWMSDGVFVKEDFKVLRGMNRRRQVILGFVDKCVEVFGFAHVYS